MARASSSALTVAPTTMSVRVSACTTGSTAGVPAGTSAKIGGPARFQTVRQALESGPMHFAKLMSALGSRDGREIVREIETLRDAGHLDRNSDGEYYLKK